ncbi:cytochrome c biogenesis protein CcdA [Saccharicrinis sp. FJH2]|uniref:protein-disulfide reductase DsbD family protein n=1 Tax=Saccharicrinis sp. FJH65 TaxID=3344659 RepID=UPI0035F37BD9
MRKTLAAALLFIVLPISVFSQIVKPVKWESRLSSTDIKANSRIDLIFSANIDEGWHLYSTKIPDNGPIATSFNYDTIYGLEPVGEIHTSKKPIEKFDVSFNMNLQYFEGKVDFIQTFKVTDPDHILVKGYVEFMTCDDERCIPPDDYDFEYEVGEAQAQVVPETKNTETTQVQATDLSQSGATDQTGLWGFFFLAFLGGLAAIFTPCVFPMIPMTMSFFLKGSENKARGKFNALVYGISIIAIYTIVGTVVALAFGANFANFLSTHWLPNILFFIIFMVFAASFFGAFEITMPSWIVNKSTANEEKGGLIGIFFMAFTLVLVSFSCTGPIVGAILVASAGGAVLTPIVGMLGFSLAFALPFTFFALFPGYLKKMPKSGGWLNTVKVVLGFVEVALGLKFLSVADQTYHWGILDREIYLAIWIVTFALLGFYFLGKLKFSHDSDVKHVTVSRLALAIVTFSFVVYLIPGMFGAPLKALAGYLPPRSTHDFDLTRIMQEKISVAETDDSQTICEKPKYAEFLHLPHGLEGYFDYDQALACAREKNKPLFIDFTGHGCVNCREMEDRVWSDPKVLKRLKEDFVIVALYVDDKTKLPETDWITSTFDGKVKKTLGKKYADFQISRYKVNSQPYYVLLDNNENLLEQPKAYDLDVDNFIEFLDKATNEFNNRE